MQLKTKFGQFGGVYAPETLVPALEELESAFISATKSSEFEIELSNILEEYAGRKTPLTFAKNISKDWGANIFLKREDLLHGGAHKTNNALGQALLAKYMGKSRLIAETGAGQHGVAVAMAGALFKLPVHIYMGSRDIERQYQNVLRMKLMGAQVHSVDTASKTLKDAINEAIRDWISNLDTTHYILGTAAGPHPFPTLVKYFQSVIGDEIYLQFNQKMNSLPDAIVACVGGGSNAIGAFNKFIDQSEVKLFGVEPGGRGVGTGLSGAVIEEGKPGCLHGMKSLVMQTDDGQIKDTHSIAAGLDYPSVGPEHSFLKETGRVKYTSATDDEAINAFLELTEKEGIIPALESSHALAATKQLARNKLSGKNIVVNLSGRGDKDMETVNSYLEKRSAQ